MVGLKTEVKRWQSELWLITNPSNCNNTQNRDDHYTHHTNTLSYHKEMLHFRLHKVVLEVGTRSLARRGSFVLFFLFQRPFLPPPPLTIPQFPDAAGMFGTLRINSARGGSRDFDRGVLF